MILHDIVPGGFNENNFVINLARETFYSKKVTEVLPSSAVIFFR